MSEDTNVIEPSELDTLKARADQMGIKYHPQIGLEKLREKVNAAISDTAEPSEDDTDTPAASAPKKPTVVELRKKAAELVRIRVTCMNPNKSEWDGELFCAGNTAVGTYKKYVPFNVEWHVPRIIYNMIKARKCQVFFTERDSRGNKSRKGKIIPEFAVEDLPPLSPKELKDLAQRQAMANGTAE